MTETTQAKNEVNKFETISTVKKEVSKAFHDNSVKMKAMMKDLGGKEAHTKKWTCEGLVVTKIVSTSPDKLTRIIYEFDFS